jgi:hypothetical protein
MSYLPKFKTAIDQDAYIGIFENKLQLYWALMTRVKNKFLGADPLLQDYEWAGMDAKTIEVFRDITSDLLYKTEIDFKEKYPEYKDSDDDIFVPRHSFKESVRDALQEAMKDQNKEEDA